MKSLRTLSCLSPIALVSVLAACGQKGPAEDRVFRIHEQLSLYSTAKEVDGDAPPEDTSGSTTTTTLLPNGPVDHGENDGEGGETTTTLGGGGNTTTTLGGGSGTTTTTLPPANPPTHPPVTPKPPVVVNPVDVHIKIRRACWDRPRDWPTVNRADDIALFSIVDPAGKRIFSKELKGDDFKKKTQTITIPGARFKGPNNTDLSKHPSTKIEVCQADDDDLKCEDGKDDKGKLDAGIIFVREGRIKEDETYEWGKAPFDVESRIDLSDVYPGDQVLEVIVENLGQYEGSKKDQIKKDYCDVVYKTTSPLALDLSGRGFLPGRQTEGGRFDLDVDGSRERMSPLGPDAGLLALDLGGNGKIDDGSELFGEATVIKATGAKAANGFDALAQYDENSDGVIDARDAVYASLKVWVDLNRNGESDDGELKSLADRQIAKLNLSSSGMLEKDMFGNEVRERSTYETNDAQSRLLVDIWFSTIDEVTAAK